MRDLLLKDFGWKLFSLFLAAFIWVTVHKIIVPQSPDVPQSNVSVIFGGVDVNVVGSFPTTPMYVINSNNVSVTVTGPREAMDHLSKDQIHAAVYLSDMQDPTKPDSLPVNVSVPWGVTVANVAPASVHVTPPTKH